MISQRLINSYLADPDRIRKISGSLTEGVISEAFKDLLKVWAKSDGLTFINQYPMQSSLKKPIRPDGAILHNVRAPLLGLQIGQPLWPLVDFGPV